jgi:hypothetical protein
LSHRAKSRDPAVFNKQESVGQRRQRGHIGAPDHGPAIGFGLNDRFDMADQ